MKDDRVRMATSADEQAVPRKSLEGRIRGNEFDAELLAFLLRRRFGLIAGHGFA
jgi:hypothetical protein